MLVQPTKDSAEDWSRDRFSPMVRDTPVLRERISDTKSRSQTNTLRHKTFPGGLLALAISNSPASLASKPIRILLFDEVDKYPLSAKKAGDPIGLGMKRTTAFWNRKILGGSTPKTKSDSKIVSRFESSDARYFHVPCPDCGGFQRLIWAQVKFIENDPKTARYLCEHCGVLWDDRQRSAAIKLGRWQATKPFNGIAGFHLNEIYSPFVRLEEMVRNFLQAKKLPETLQQWINESLGEPWEETGATVEGSSLLERREQYGPDNIPADVLMLTAGADVQDDRVEVQLIGWGVDEESWIIAQEVFRGDPDKPELWNEVDEYLQRQFSTEDGRQLFIEATAIDSGGHNTQAVYQFVVSRKRRRVWAIKGLGGAGKLVWPKKATRTAKSRANVFVIGVDTIKGVLYGRLSKVLEPGPGYIHLPASADEEFCKQLTSEKSITKYVRGRPTLAWEPREKGIRQEVQDCWNYGYAAFIGRRGPELIKRLSRRIASRSVVRQEQSIEREQFDVQPMADTQSERQSIAQQQTKQPRPFRPRRSGFVKGWRR